jgi:hypothetical protein
VNPNLAACTSCKGAPLQLVGAPGGRISSLSRAQITLASSDNETASDRSSLPDDHDDGSELPRFVRDRGTELSLVACCVRTIARNFDRYQSLAGLPKELVQHIFAELHSKRLLAQRHLPLLSAAGDGALAQSPALTDAWLAVLGHAYGALTSLDVSGCVAVTDDGVREIARLSRLSRLRLDHCLRIGDAALQARAGPASPQRLAAPLRHDRLITLELTFGVVPVTRDTLPPISPGLRSARLPARAGAS